MKAISLKCVNCGANLEIGSAVDNFACAYCGTEQRVERSGGIVSLSRIENTLSEIRQGTDRTASELALTRLKAEVASIYAQHEVEVHALRAADEKSNGIVGFSLLFGGIASIALFGWWGIAVIVLGLVLGWRFIPTISDKIAEVERNTARRIAPLQEQISKHLAVVASYDPRPK